MQEALCRTTERAPRRACRRVRARREGGGPELTLAGAVWTTEDVRCSPEETRSSSSCADGGGGGGKRGRKCGAGKGREGEKQCVDRRPAEGGREFAVIKMGRIGNKVCRWEKRREISGEISSVDGCLLDEIGGLEI